MKYFLNNFNKRFDFGNVAPVPGIKTILDSELFKMMISHALYMEMKN